MVCYHKIKGRCLVPKTFFFLVKYKDIVIMLMKLFFENGKVNMELNLRKYMMEKGYCPHGHALELFTNA